MEVCAATLFRHFKNAAIVAEVSRAIRSAVLAGDDTRRKHINWSHLEGAEAHTTVVRVQAPGQGARQPDALAAGVGAGNADARSNTGAPAKDAVAVKLVQRWSAYCVPFEELPSATWNTFQQVTSWLLLFHGCAYDRVVLPLHCSAQERL